MRAFITKVGTSQPEGDRNNGSLYPKFERRYFQRVYGSDHLNQLHDGHQKRAILRYCRPERREEIERILNQLAHLQCENADDITPGRSAYSLKLLEENLLGYTRQQARSLRWNEHYNQALDLVSKDMMRLLRKGRALTPASIVDVATSESIQRNLDKHAGFLAFRTGKRSKGENLDVAIKWCSDHYDEVISRQQYGIPLVPSHRSSNSKPVSDHTWKWRCRIILMQDLRALLMDGRFLLPFTELFKDCPWGEGSMTHEDVDVWIQKTRQHYTRFYSSDYSKFDLCQPAWLLEDVFYRIIRPCFGELSDMDEQAFRTMVNSYVTKDIHTWFGTLKVHGCQISGSMGTYAINTIVNQVMDLTSILMQGCDPAHFKSIKCGDDNLTFYSRFEPWDKDKHCELLLRYFGMQTTLGERDHGDPREKNPTFLSREWTMSGAKRSIREVLWNLVYPERWREYDPEVTHMTVDRAAALLLVCGYFDQPVTMRQYFNIPKVMEVAKIHRRDSVSTYQALAAIGSGFNDPWIRFKFGNLKSQVLRNQCIP